MGSHRDERWPLSPNVLADRTRCPDCFTLISAPVCPRCGFVLTDPRAARLLELGTAIAEADRQRRILLNEIRLDPLPAPATFEGVAAPVARPAAEAPLVDPTASAPEAVMSETATPAPDMAAPSSQPVPMPGAAEPAQGRTPASDAPPPALPAHPSTALTPSPAAPSPTPTALSSTSPAPSPASPAPASAAPASAPPAPPRRRLTVPVLLLIVGVSLVGIAAIFFLTLAWFVADVLVRALIIAGVTAAVIAAASLLRRRRLTATAEGVAALGVLLLGLDAWGVRANDLLGAGATDAAVYTGVAVLAVGALCRAWALASSLRVPDLAAVVAVPAGLGFLVAGIADLPAPGGLVAGLLGASAGGLAHALPRPWSSARSRTDAVPERTALAVAGVVAVALSAVLTPFASPGSLLWLALAVVVLAVAHAVAARRDRADLPWAGALAHTASVVGVVTAATLGWQLSGVSPNPVVAFLVAPVLAVAVPVAVDRFARRRDAFAPARIAGALVGVVSVAAVVLRDVGAALPLIAHRWVPWRMDAFAGTPVRHQELALIAAVLCAALLFAAPSLGRRLLRDARPVAAALLLLAAATRTGLMAAITGTAIAVVVAGLVLLALRTRAAGSPARPTATGAGVTIALGAVVACTAGAATPWLWFTAVAVTVAAPVAARVISSPTGPVALLLTLAPVAVATIAAAIAPQPIAVLADAMPPGPSAAIALVQWVAALTLLAAVVLRLDAPSRSALALAGGGLALVTIGAGLPALLGAEPDAARAALVDPTPAAVVRAVALLGLVALLALSRTRFTAAAVLLAALTTAPAAAWAARTVLVGTGALAPAVAPLTAMIAAVAVSIGAAVLTLRSGGAARRGLADAGAALVVASVVWAVPTADAWMALLALAAGFAAAATTHGWAAPASVRLAGVPTAPIGGVPWRRAPRRLLVWPAIGAATQALWARLATTDAPLEAFTVPPALALLVLAATAVWLRRHPEATVATSLAFAIGLIVPALESWDGSPARGTVVAAVAAVLCLALTCTPARRVVGPAWAGAAVALVALGAVVVPRAADGETPLWLLLLVAVALAAGLGATRTDAVSLHVFAFVAPPAALLWSLAGLSPHAGSLTTIVVALTIAATLHLASAWQNVAPFAVPTRASAVVALAVIAGLGLGSDALPVLEAATLPVAVVVLAGAALALWRAAAATRAVDAGVPPDSAARPASGARALAIERVVWVSGAVLAVAPSVLAPASPARWWTVIVLSLLAAGVAASVSRSVASVAGLVVPTTLVLAGAGIAMGARALLSDADGGALAAFVAGTGAVAVAAVRVWREPRPTPVPPALAAVGGGLVFVTTLVPALSSSGEVTVLRTVATAVLAAAGALGGATLLGTGRWAGLGGWPGLGGVIAIGGTVTAGTALGIRFALGRGGLEADLCALAVLVIVAAVGALALRRTRVPLVDAVVGGAFAVTIVLFAVAELTLLRAAGHEWRALLVTSALVAMGVLGQAFAVRVGRAVSIAALVALVLFGGAALLLGAIPAIETLTVPVAAGLLVLGIRAMRDPEVRTWPALGPGLAVLTLPSLAYDLGGNALWRVVALGVAALALVVLGAMRRLQAPLVLGSVVLLVHGVAQLWPWIAATYVAVPWWLWLGIGGVLLILLAARYERQMRALRTAFTAVAALR